MQHFTGTSESSAEALLRESLPQLASDIKALRIPELLAVCLGGGYGRGEGGVRKTPDGAFTLYNDLDLFTIVRTGTPKSARQRIVNELGAISQHWSQILKVDVDFSYPVTLHEMKRNSRKLMMQELVRGHIVLVGDANLIRKTIPILPPESLPKLEAMRLMFNRGMGLLFAHERLNSLNENSQQPDFDFINRNLNKCVLGIGDSWLMMIGEYRWGIEERAELIEELKPDTLGRDFPRRYREAVQRKFTPNSILPPDVLRIVNELREQWLMTICTFVGQPAQYLIYPDAIATSLHLFCRKNHLCGIRNFLRWFIRTGDIELSNTTFDEPLIKALALLFRAHVNDYQQLQEFSEEERAWLQKLWQLFN